MRLLLSISGALVVVALATVISIVGASWYWRVTTMSALTDLKQGVNGEDSGSVVTFAELDSDPALPPSVRRYFKTVLKDGQPIVRSVWLKQRGTFAAKDSPWRPFYAEETVVTEPIGFVWDARIRMAPLVSVLVRDSYVRHKASMRGSVLGMIKVVDAHNRPELDSGALHRYLAEALWFPTALLPSQGVTWTAVDDSRAVATLTDGVTTVSMEFTFAPNGEIASMFTPNRYREENGRYIPTPWGATVKRYSEWAGMRIPVESEVYWKINNQVQPYWRGEVIHAAVASLR